MSVTKCERQQKFAFQLIRMQTSYVTVPKLTKNYFKLVVGHVTKQVKQGCSCDIQI